MKLAFLGGAGGFIGSHMLKKLKEQDYWVLGADLKHSEFNPELNDSIRLTDLRNSKIVDDLFNNYYFDLVIQLAADMGGAGFVFSKENDADIMHNSVLINANIAHAASKYGCGKLFYSSSACIYPQQIQEDPNNKGLKESDAYPANPDSCYGWEKLFSEQLYDSFHRNKGLNVYIGRFHNILGELGTYKGGREKAPAALCRKIAEAKNGDSIEIWGDGEQTRTFLHVSECIEGIFRLLDSDHHTPINIGSDELISINDLAKMIIEISGKDLSIKHIDGPQGVRGRSSDNTLIKEVLQWAPSQSLRIGIEKLYDWINQQING